MRREPRVGGAGGPVWNVGNGERRKAGARAPTPRHGPRPWPGVHGPRACVYDVLALPPLAVPEQTRFSYEHQIRMQIRFYTGVQNARRAGTVVR